MRNFIFILIAFCAPLVCLGQEMPISIENLSKKWSIIDLINPDFTQEQYEESLNILKGTTLELKTDGTSIYSFMIDLVGTWELDKENNIIIVKNRRGVNEWQIHKLTKDSIILSLKDSKQKIIFQEE